MDTLTVELTAALIDNLGIPSARTKVALNLRNYTGRLRVEYLEGTPRSVHRFTVTDAAALGCGAPYNLTAEQASFVLATACSLVTPRLLFSPLQPQRFAPSLDRGRIPAKGEVTDTPTGKRGIMLEIINIIDSVTLCLETKEPLDETRIFGIVKKMLALRPFDSGQGTFVDLNIREALKRYREALMSSDRLSCYSSLYSALEKAVNADEDRKGKSFDDHASDLTGLPASEVKELRLFSNRIKHALHNDKDLTTLREGEAQLGQMTRSLKSATDRAILARL